ncbi:hypothetical protein DFA_10153 [Cavenderia fasciculata]|uniref:Uncharacterized protein n=1 Tax=Cavenderia fasciculata TaxID=261658 RepID=F4Q9F0_CACFS|nr:uncharacterized protein DFA_10153 [Cavenderia fasciculata]EGG15319.1 hypothetical protein DFA_10153 [Cavenderia fasciculata]|eukprot:XP_004352039.1 hypothetical protein DFA_10153 [Cavenderia fasciculata]
MEYYHDLGTVLQPSTNVNWWVVLTDATDSADAMYSTGVYIDSTMADVESFTDGQFKELITRQIKVASDRNKVFVDALLAAGERPDCGDLATKGLVHQNGSMKLKLIEEEMVSQNTLLDKIDIDAKTGYFISHSMRIPGNTGRELGKVYDPFLLNKGKGTTPNHSQHSICINVNADELKSMLKMWTLTRPQLINSNLLCLLFPMDDESAESQGCDTQWRAYVNTKGAGKTLTDIKTMLADSKAYEITKKHCMYNEGTNAWKELTSAGLSFKVHGFLSRSLNGCNIGTPYQYMKHLMSQKDSKISKCLENSANRDYCHPAELIDNKGKKRVMSNTLDDNFNQICTLKDVGLDQYLVLAQDYNEKFIVSTDQTHFPTLSGPGYGVYRFEAWKTKFSFTLATNGIDKNFKPRANAATHEKLAISTTSDRICFGDSNRDFKQIDHAGIAICFEHPVLHAFLLDRVESVDIKNHVVFGKHPTLDITTSPNKLRNLDVNWVITKDSSSVYWPGAPTIAEKKAKVSTPSSKNYPPHLEILNIIDIIASKTGGATITIQSIQLVRNQISMSTLVNLSNLLLSQIISDIQDNVDIICEFKRGQQQQYSSLKYQYLKLDIKSVFDLSDLGLENFEELTELWVKSYCLTNIGIFPNSLTSLTLGKIYMPPPDIFASLTSLVTLKIYLILDEDMESCIDLEALETFELGGECWECIEIKVPRSIKILNILVYIVQRASTYPMPRLERLKVPQSVLIDGRVILSSSPLLKKLVITNCYLILPANIVPLSRKADNQSN